MPPPSSIADIHRGASCGSRQVSESSRLCIEQRLHGSSLQLILTAPHYRRSLTQRKSLWESLPPELTIDALDALANAYSDANKTLSIYRGHALGELPM